MTSLLPKPAIEAADLTRPIIGINNRTAQEVFDIMCDRIRMADPIGVMTIGSIDRLCSGLADHEMISRSDAWKQARNRYDYSATVPVFLAPPAPALPEGWKAVPAMPTDAMIHAAACAHFGKRQVEKTGVRGIDMTANEINYTFLQAFRRFWKGALAAAPEPPAPAADPVKAQLVEALKEIIETGGGAFAGDYHAECIDIARAALAAAEEGR